MTRPRLVLLLACLLGCSTGKLDRKTASELISESFGKSPRLLMVVIGRVGSHCSTLRVGSEEIQVDMNPETSIETVVAMKAGYLTIAPNGKDYWRVSLTTKGQAVIDSEHKRFYAHQAQRGCDFQQTDFTVATPNLIAVSGLTVDENSPEASYLWRWEPSELGLALRENGDLYLQLTPKQRDELRKDFADTTIARALPIPVPLQREIEIAKARFKKYDDGWRLE